MCRQYPRTMSEKSHPISATSTRAPQSLGRSVANTLKGSAGNLVEWYDVYVYSVFAKAFEHQFFSEEDSNSTIYVWAIFAVTFVMRPVGSWYFGRFADRHGRKAALTFSIMVMAGCSFVIALTPTRESIGVWAAVILILCRLIQGFATGGEYGTSATYMSEAAVAKHRGFLSSFQYVTLVGGHVLAQTVFLAMLLFADMEWISGMGWRIAFLIGGLGALVVLWLRRTMDESMTQESIDAARSGESKESGSLKELVTVYWRELLVCFLVTMGGTLAFYGYSVNGPNVVKASFSEDAITGSVISLIALTLLMILQPIGGAISDRVGRRTLLVFFGVGGVLFTWVMFLVLPGVTNPVVAFLILAVGFVILTGYTSINAIVKAEIFPVHVRALGVGLGYALANSIFGGTAPVIWSAAKANHAGLFVVYATVTIGLSLMVYLFMLRNRGLNWLDNPEEMTERKNGPDHKHFPMGV